MRTVYFHSSLQKFTNRSKHILDVDKPSDLASFLHNLFPQLNQDPMLRLSFIDLDTNEIITDKEFLKDQFNDSTINIGIVPTISGGGGKVGMIALAAALIAASFIPGMQGIAFLGLSLAKVMFTIGLNLAIGALVSILTAKPKSKGSVDEAQHNNGIFSGLTMTTTPDTAIPLIYGLQRTSGHHISAYIKTIEHEKTAEIKVIDNVS